MANGYIGKCRCENPTEKYYSVGDYSIDHTNEKMNELCQMILKSLFFKETLFPLQELYFPCKELRFPLQGLIQSKVK